MTQLAETNVQLYEISYHEVPHNISKLKTLAGKLQCKIIIRIVLFHIDFYCAINNFAD